MDKLKNIKQIIFDADDTLWENNIYYVQAAESFIKLIAKGGFRPEEIENEFDKLEKKVFKERGYGSRNFVYILEEIYKMYINRGLKADGPKFQKILKRFIEHPVSPPKMFDSVAETMHYLNKKYDLSATNICVLECGGKNNIHIFMRVLNNFKIPYVVL